MGGVGGWGGRFNDRQGVERRKYQGCAPASVDLAAEMVAVCYCGHVSRAEMQALC